MYTVLLSILLATSIIILIFTNLLQIKRRRALERVLSLSKKQDNKLELEQLKVAALKEIEILKNLEKNKLDAELRAKRMENDAEISLKQQGMNTILENYKNEKIKVIENELKIKQIAAEQEYDNKILECGDKLQSILNQIDNEQSNINQLRTNQESITEALRRKALENNQYRISFTDSDHLEIDDLQAIASRYPRVRQIILKAIYEIYIAPEVKKLVSRVVGESTIMGIYRISSILDGRVYIGKSVNIKDRWITHFKRAAGVESETLNLLYPAMRKDGFETFSFEIIERVTEEDKLSSREKYWQEFYQAKTHGFSVK